MREQYKKFYTEYKTRLFGYLLQKCGDRETAQDVVQESFTRHLHHYGDASASPSLLFTIARNVLTDHHRHHRRFTTMDDTVPAEGQDSEQHLLAREKTEKVYEAMQQLGKTDREVLVLAVKGVSYQSIADALGISLGNVKVRVHRARSELRTYLANKGS